MSMIEVNADEMEAFLTPPAWGGCCPCGKNAGARIHHAEEPPSSMIHMLSPDGVGDNTEPVGTKKGGSPGAGTATTTGVGPVGSPGGSAPPALSPEELEAQAVTGGYGENTVPMPV